MGPSSTTTDPIEPWALSGAMHLTGRSDGPALGPPLRLVEVLTETGREIVTGSASVGHRVKIDPLAVLAERGALLGLTRQGSASCGGMARLLPTTDGWVAASLPRPDDLTLLPAWLGIDEPTAGPDWNSIGAVIARSRAGDVSATAAELGLAVAAVGCVGPGDGPPVKRTSLGSAAPRSLPGLRVVDLSSLWAGPLCTRLLADAGADVVKVESWSRPDGARSGSTEFFDLMNSGKRSVAIDLSSSEGHKALARLLASADVVVEGSRPRVLEQMGVDALALASDGPAIWLSITGYGRAGPGRNRVAFGDDAAAAGGALVWDADGPCFSADAVADPVTGMMAAAAVFDAVAGGGRWLLDVAMSRCAAAVGGPTIEPNRPIDVTHPSIPKARGKARTLGADNDDILGSPDHRLSRE